MDNTAYKTYFQNIAISHKQILHSIDGKKAFFYTNDGQEVTQTVSGTGVSFPCMVLSIHNGKFADQNVIKNMMFGSFEIRDKVADATNYDNILAAYTNCYNIGQQIIAKIQRDMEDLGYNGAVPNFNINTVSYVYTGPMSDAQYGCKFSFELMDDAYSPYSFNPDTYFNS